MEKDNSYLLSNGIFFKICSVKSHYTVQTHFSEDGKIRNLDNF